MTDSPNNGNEAKTPASVNSAECAEFQSHLPELLSVEDADIMQDPHVRGCENCTALVRDLESIAQAARELLPVYDPSPDLWSQISTAMKQEPAIDPTIMNNGKTQTQ
jgi:hypothetical protein